MSLASRLVPVAITVTGRGRRWRSADALYDAVAARPSWPAEPPAALRRRVQVRDRRIAGLRFVELDAGSGDLDPVIYLHGGGYVFDIDPLQWAFAASLARGSRRPVLVARYPLAPVGTAEPTIAAIVAAAAELADGRAVGLAGDSAGAGMAVAAAQVLADRGLPGIPLALSSPWVDVTMSDFESERIAATDPWLAPPGLRAAGELWRGALDATDPRVSPIYGRFEGLGPMAIAGGTRDVLFPDARRLVAAARASGTTVDWLAPEGLMHNFAVMPIPEARAGVRLLARVLRLDPQRSSHP